MIEGLGKEMSETKEQTAETKESFIPDFMKKESDKGIVSFTGGIKDESNYNYYMKEANSHKESAESDANWARQRLEWAESYAKSNPDKAKSYVDEAKNWQSKADSELRASRDDIEKANSYK